LCGLAFFIYGVVVQVNLKNSLSVIQTTYPLHGIIIIVIGVITVAIAFFGCFGAIRENRCMLITFRILMSIILVVQITLSTYFVVVFNQMKDAEFKHGYKEIFNEYWVDPYSQTMIDLTQMYCCGVDGPNDFMQMPNSTGKYPWSCCRSISGLNFEACSAEEVYRSRYHSGCYDNVIHAAKYLSYGYISYVNRILLGIVAAEFIEIIFAFCLANSIRNVERRSIEVQELLR
ncbi:hypothetical protein PV326_008952, partial [Microctonus aethiopoides]